MEIKELTKILTLSYFYNKEANETIKSIVERTILDAINNNKVKNVKPLYFSQHRKTKNIVILGGQGSGKSTLRDSIYQDREQNDKRPAWLNLDSIRPLILDYNRCALDEKNTKDQKKYGSYTEDEARIIKAKQWEVIANMSKSNTLPNLLLDTTNIDHVQFKLLSEKSRRVSIVFVHTPLEEAQKRVAQRALESAGILGITKGRSSLEEEIIEGHHQSSADLFAMLIHNVGINTKIQILDGTCSGSNKPLIAKADLKVGHLTIYDLNKFLEIPYKSASHKDTQPPTAKDLLDQTIVFQKLALTIPNIKFTDKESGKAYLQFTNKGIIVLDKLLYKKNNSEFLQQSINVLQSYLESNRSSVLTRIAKEKGRVFEKRSSFTNNEFTKIVSGKFETEVPVGTKEDGAIVDMTLELRQLAKRGCFLDKEFDPWRKLAPDEMRMLASREVVDRWFTKEMLERIAAEVINYVNKNPLDNKRIIHIAHPVKDYTRPGVNINYVALTYAYELSQKLNSYFKEKYPSMNVTFKNDRPLLALASDRVKRTMADSVSRITSQPLFDSDQFQNGDVIVFADDHTQFGGVCHAYRNITNHKNLVTIAYTALSSHSLGLDIKADNFILEALGQSMQKCAKFHGGKHEEFELMFDYLLSKVGLSKDTLTNMEALFFIATMIDGNDPSEIRWFKGLEKKINNDIQVREGLDSFDSFLKQPPVHPSELCKMVEKRISESRKVVYPNLGN
jgi:hypothetical protein